MLMIMFKLATEAGQQRSSDGFAPTQGEGANHLLAEAPDEIVERWDELDRWVNEIVGLSGGE
jgi:hypothetical protein